MISSHRQNYSLSCSYLDCSYKLTFWARKKIVYGMNPVEKLWNSSFNLGSSLNSIIVVRSPKKSWISTIYPVNLCISIGLVITTSQRSGLFG